MQRKQGKRDKTKSKKREHKKDKNKNKESVIEIMKLDESNNNVY